MDSLIMNATINIEEGLYDDALTDAEDALEPANRLRDSEAIERIENIIERIALLTLFYDLINEAEVKIEENDFEEALIIYETALSVANEFHYNEGIDLVNGKTEHVLSLIVEAKRNEAQGLVNAGDGLYNAEMYDIALEFYYLAAELYREIEDFQKLMTTNDKISDTIRRIEEATGEPQIDADNGSGVENPEELESNYEFNRTLDFDLQTMIDNQNRAPVNRVRMGSRDGLNEGWYNGCGWIAVYNALIRLDDPKHPAEIVRYFEESGGTVFGGIFGTYPNAIESYLKSLGHDVKQILFPQVNANIDELTKSSNMVILAYLHTSAAHYVAAEFCEELNKFIIYNDRFAQILSEKLGFENLTDSGAALDSIISFINDTNEILFSFSLIVIDRIEN